MIEILGCRSKKGSLALNQGFVPWLSSKAQTIGTNPAASTELGGDYALSDDKLSEHMDAQIKPGAAARL